MKRFQTAQATNCSPPCYAFCYDATPKESTKAAPPDGGVMPPPTNVKTVCYCCKQGVWSDCATSAGPCQGAMYFLIPGDDPNKVIGMCLEYRSEMPCGTGSTSYCYCAYVRDSCTNKIRYAYPCEYNDPAKYHVFYGPSGLTCNIACNTCSR